MKVINLVDATDRDSYGGKASNLAKLLVNGLPVPDGFVVGIGAFDDDGKLTEDAVKEIGDRINGSKLYAVRSSALAEDAGNASWAGQFETFLNTSPDDVVAKIEKCHNSSEDRARAYAKSQDESVDFHIAVVVQEMLNPEYAGVLFTKDPISGKDHLVTEYVEGLGEELVSGRSDPKHARLDSDEEMPFDGQNLAELAAKVEKAFGEPQDIEWASENGKIWLVQTRPITAISKNMRDFYLGEPEESFYWGPSRANVRYMGDFMAGLDRLFVELSAQPDSPTPPDGLTLFYDEKVVFLFNAREYSRFTEQVFSTYLMRGGVDDDIKKWREIVGELPKLTGAEFNEKLVEAWYLTEMPEFSLYGAEAFITKKLQRFDERTLPKIWGAFTQPDKFSFLNVLDNELAEVRDPAIMARKYPWIRDGYAGPNDEAEWYFAERLRAIDKDGLLQLEDNVSKRNVMATEYGLSDEELEIFAFTRKLAEFMDERKEWMMRTRRLIKESIGQIEYGWGFAGGKIRLIDENDTRELWKRYVDFKMSTSAVKGVVANTGGRHFVSGKVAVLYNHTDPVEDGRILVVPSTSPGWVPLMRKAKALVTDHGGMMSHAAIVAREFNLPCIVSTKQATKVLQDGDMVVLDLVKGEVNK